MSGLVKDNKTIVVVLTNVSNGPVGDLFWGICTLLHSLKMSANFLLRKPEKELPNLKDIIGFYEVDYGPQLFSQINSNLVLLDPGNTNPASSMQILTHKEGHNFIVTGGGPNISPGEDICFTKSSDGEMVYLDCSRGEHKRFEFVY